MGCSGSGKTTLTKQLSLLLHIPAVELDSIFHQPHWTSLSDEDFIAQVSQVLRECPNGWIVDGNYNTALGDLVVGQANTVLWFDLPRIQVMSRVIRRSIHRVITREMLWNGNRERWSNLFHWNPEKSIIMWSWTRHQAYRDRLQKAANSAPNNQVWIRLSSQKDVDAIVKFITSGSSDFTLFKPQPE